MSIKKLCLAMAAAGLCASAANAGHMGKDVMLPAAPPTVNVTIPQYQGSWELAVEAKYMQTTNGDFHYATTTLVEDDGLIVSTDSKVHTVTPEHDWGWLFEVGYNFEGNGRDVRLSWMHLDNKDSDHEEFDGAFLTDTFGITDWDDIKGDSRNEYNHVDLVFGQSMDFGQKVTLRAFGGLRYADIDNRDKANYRFSTIVDEDTPRVVDSSVRVKSDFEGLGPRAGVDAKVRLGSGFSIVGTIAGSLLTGTVDQSLFSDFRVVDDGDVVFGFDITDKISSSHRVVPEMDARLGVNYTHGFSPDTSFGIEVGYEVINYFDVKDTSFTSYTDSQGHDNDFALNGVYVRAQLEVA